ncbi:MAG: PqqD family peptide modification chaperone [Bacteroidales bacterium]|nr:PqqD family peptide modification chaperone [Bacteroidales bacterium]
MKTIQGFTLRPLGKEFIITAESIKQINFNKMISLNESAAYLWKSVDGKEFTAEDLADLLVERYEISRDIALRDSEAIAAKWIEAGIVTE